MVLPVDVPQLGTFQGAPGEPGTPGPPGPPISPEELNSAIGLVLPGAVAAEVSEEIASQRLVGTRIVAATGGSWTSLNSVSASTAVGLEVQGDALGKPVANSWSWKGWHISGAGNSAVQLLTSLSSPSQTWIRSRPNDTWTEWREVVAFGEDFKRELPGAFRLLDDDGRVAFQVREDGSAQIGSAQVNSSKAFRILDSEGRVAFQVRPGGSAELSGARIEPSKAFRILDNEGRVAFQVREDGSVEAPALTTGGSGGGGITGRREFHIGTYGPVSEALYLTNGAMTAGAATLTSPTYVFTAADVGKRVGVRGAGPISSDYMVLANDGVLVASIIAVTDGVATLSTTATNTVTAAEMIIGVPIDSALSAALTAAASAGGGTVVIPPGVYVAANSQPIPSRVSVRGAGRMQTTVYVTKISTAKTAENAAWLREGPWETDLFLHDVNLSDFTCDGRFFAASTGYSYQMKMIHMSSTKNSSARQLRILNNPATALGYDNSINCVLEENIIENFARLNVVDPTSPAGGSGGSGIGTATGGRGGEVSIIIRNNFIKGNWTAAGGAGHACILIEAASNTPAPNPYPAAVIIEGNILSGGFTGITESGGSDTKILGNDISRCNIGIYLGNNAVPEGMVARDAIVANNTVRDGVTAPGHTCVGLLITTVTGVIDSEGRTLVHHNVFRTGAGVGIRLDATVYPLRHMHLMGNAIRDHSGRGIEVDGVFFDLVIAHHQISSNGRGGAQQEAIRVASGSTWTDGSLIGNIFTDYAASPTQTNTCVRTGATLTRVLISSNTGDL